MKFSYVMLPDYPLDASLRAIRLADQLGFYGCYAADETWHKDLWQLFAVAAKHTERIRLGPSVSGVVLREPTLIAQAAATLDELSNGRAEVVLGSGNFGLLAQYGMNWKQMRPLSRLKEGVQVIRSLLDDGAITFEGEFFNYHGLFTFARPVQQHLPVKIGSMRGPRSFEVAGRFADGCHHALSYTKAAYEYGLEHFREGAKQAGKNPDDMDFGAWMVVAVGRDSEAAKQVARSMVGIYASSMPAEQLERNGVDPDALAPIIQAVGDGDLARGVELTTPELTEKLSISRTPEEVTAKLKTEVEGTGVNHIIAAITDSWLVKAFTGQQIDGAATVEEQLQLIADEVMPNLS
jgi:5,10-methylenetetrahydromethanopterin reductase